MKNKCIGFKVLNPTSSFPISLTKKRTATAYIAHKKIYLNFTLEEAFLVYWILVIFPISLKPIMLCLLRKLFFFFLKKKKKLQDSIFHDQNIILKKI